MLEWKVVNTSYSASKCGRYTISRAPASNHVELGCDMTYTLWHGKEMLHVERCKNYAAERTEAIAEVTRLANEHADTKAAQA